MATIANMTLEELQQLIDARIDERLTHPLGKFELDQEELFVDDEPDTRSWEQVKQEIELDRWTPPAGREVVIGTLTRGSRKLMAIYIVDASVVIEYLVTGTYISNAQALFDQATSNDRFIVPEFCLLECTNVLS
ncbi:MAG: hypothetical protein MUF87_11150 [Anaerolineae bacterium]|jgi:hypothetical protein|nr:hypothetical protein [Anaerolineae bacterium]